MQHDEEKFLDLLQPYVSDETKRARRILTFSSFIVISLSFLGLSVSSFRFFGADLSSAPELRVQALTFLLLLFWSVILIVNIRRDSAIQSEKDNFLVARLEAIQEIIDQQNKLQEKNPISSYVHQDYHNCLKAMEAYDHQKTRTKQLTVFQKVLTYTDTYLPFILFSVSILVLTAGLIRTILISS